MSDQPKNQEEKFIDISAKLTWAQHVVHQRQLPLPQQKFVDALVASLISGAARHYFPQGLSTDKQQQLSPRVMAKIQSQASVYEDQYELSWDLDDPVQKLSNFVLDMVDQPTLKHALRVDELPKDKKKLGLALALKQRVKKHENGQDQHFLGMYGLSADEQLKGAALSEYNAFLGEQASQLFTSLGVKDSDAKSAVETLVRSDAIQRAKVHAHSEIAEHARRQSIEEKDRQRSLEPAKLLQLQRNLQEAKKYVTSLADSEKKLRAQAMIQWVEAKEQAAVNGGGVEHAFNVFNMALASPTQSSENDAHADPFTHTKSLLMSGMGERELQKFMTPKELEYLKSDDPVPLRQHVELMQKYLERVQPKNHSEIDLNEPMDERAQLKAINTLRRDVLIAKKQYELSTPIYKNLAADQLASVPVLDQLDSELKLTERILLERVLTPHSAGRNKKDQESPMVAVQEALEAQRAMSVTAQTVDVLGVPIQLAHFITTSQQVMQMQQSNDLAAGALAKIMNRSGSSGRGA